MKELELEKNDIKFIKMRNGEDLVAYLVTENEDTITIRRPLCVFIENDMLTGKQLLNIREWLPPIITKIEVVKVPKSDVLFMVEVNGDFEEQFQEVVDYFYSVKPKKKAARESSAGQKVVSIEDLLSFNDGKKH